MQDLIELIKIKEIGKYYENVSLTTLTTYKVGGCAKLLVYPEDVSKLIRLLKLIKKNKLKYKVLGNGSNVLFSDNVFDGVIIKLDRLNNIELTGNTIIVGAGYPLMKLASFATRKELSGLEFASGIPGSVGGAVFMNAGAYKSDMGYIVSSIKVITPDFKIITLTNRELNFHYRTSFLKHNKDYICIEVKLKLKKGKKEVIEEIIRDRKKRRLSSQPLEYPSAGSVFRNPEGMFVGKLIEDLGLKGLYKGNAQISEKHANFIINRGNCKANDIKDLIDLVKDAVRDNYDVELKVEQEFVNWE